MYLAQNDIKLSCVFQISSKQLQQTNDYLVFFPYIYHAFLYNTRKISNLYDICIIVSLSLGWLCRACVIIP